MKKLMLLASAGFLIAAPACAAPAVAMSATVKRDVQCFVLYSVAVNDAVSSKNDKMKEAGSLGVMYFLGKVKASAPDLNFAEAVHQEANAFDANPEAGAIGKACDEEFGRRGGELINLGKQLSPAP